MLDRGKEFMDELPEVVSKFFKSIVKDVRKLWFLRALFENEPEIQDYGHSLIEMIMAKGSNRLKGAINVWKTCIGTEGDER
jgi:hypothetical protein